MRSPSPDCLPTGWAAGARDPGVVGAGVRVWGPCSVPSAGTPCGGCAPRGGSVAFMCWGAGGGGGACAVPPSCAAGGGPVGRGVALPHSVTLPSLGRQQSGCLWRCAVHGGRGPPYHSGSCSPGFSGYDLCGVLARRRGLACSSRPPWGPAAWAGGRVALRLLSRAGGDHPPCLGGWGPEPPRPAGRWGVGGGVVAPRPPCSPSGRRPAVLNPGPLRVAGALPSGVCMRSGPKCCPGVGGVGGGPRTAPPGALADLNPPSAFLSGLWSREGHVGRGLHTVPLCALPRHASVGSREQVQRPLPPPRHPPGSGGAEGRARGSPAGGGCGGGGECGGPSGPLAMPPDGRGGGGMAVLAPGASHRLGGRALPPPPST